MNGFMCYKCFTAISYMCYNRHIVSMSIKYLHIAYIVLFAKTTDIFMHSYPRRERSKCKTINDFAGIIVGREKWLLLYSIHVFSDHLGDGNSVGQEANDSMLGCILAFVYSTSSHPISQKLYDTTKPHRVKTHSNTDFAVMQMTFWNKMD